MAGGGKLATPALTLSARNNTLIDQITDDLQGCIQTLGDFSAVP